MKQGQKYKKLWEHYEQLYANKSDNLGETDKVLETYNLSILNDDGTENLSRLITNKETESLIKSLATKSRTRQLHWWILTKHSKNCNQSVSDFGEGKPLRRVRTLSNTFDKTRFTLISKVDKNHTHTRTSQYPWWTKRHTLSTRY